MLRKVEILWRLLNTNRSGTQTRYTCALVHLALLRSKIDAPSACGGIFGLWWGQVNGAWYLADKSEEPIYNA